MQGVLEEVPGRAVPGKRQEVLPKHSGLLQGKAQASPRGSQADKRGDSGQNEQGLPLVLVRTAGKGRRRDGRIHA